MGIVDNESALGRLARLKTVPRNFDVLAPSVLRAKVAIRASVLGSHVEGNGGADHGQEAEQGSYRCPRCIRGGTGFAKPQIYQNREVSGCVSADSAPQQAQEGQVAERV